MCSVHTLNKIFSTINPEARVYNIYERVIFYIELNIGIV